MKRLICILYQNCMLFTATNFKVFPLKCKNIWLGEYNLSLIPIIVQLLSHLWLCDFMDCSTPDSSFLHYLPEFIFNNIDLFIYQNRVYFNFLKTYECILISLNCYLPKTFLLPNHQINNDVITRKAYCQINQKCSKNLNMPICYVDLQQ